MVVEDVGISADRPGVATAANRLAKCPNRLAKCRLPDCRLPDCRLPDCRLSDPAQRDVLVNLL